MKAAILTVGTEILFGSIVNTNAKFISEQLQSLGIDLMYHMTVGDNAGRLKDMLGELYKDCDLVVVTGGLGPTQDDLTKETIADYFGVKNLENKEQLEILLDHFEKNQRHISPNNLKQANFPEGSIILKNPNGTAPGFILEKNGEIIIAMPGPPREMQPMFLNEVRPYLSEKQGSYLYYKTLRCIDIGESSFETLLLPLIDGQTDPTLATYAKDHEVTLRIASKRSTAEEAEQAVLDMCEKVKQLAGKYIYSTENEELSEYVVKELINRGISIASAESMTGGGFAKAVTDIAGSSAILSSSFVTYADEAKIELLGVNKDTIDKYSVVSKQVAEEMARGLHNRCGADICISVTGYAGPSGEDVGQYFVGLCYNNDTISIERHAFRYDRKFIREHAIHEMFALIYKTVLR